MLQDPKRAIEALESAFHDDKKQAISIVLRSGAVIEVEPGQDLRQSGSGASTSIAVRARRIQSSSGVEIGKSVSVTIVIAAMDCWFHS